MCLFLIVLPILMPEGNIVFSQISEKIFPGADEKTPSRSEYFSWINNTGEGSTEEQTLRNLDFFQWLHDAYGMTLDIYAFDAGNIDKGEYFGSDDKSKFEMQFPRGYEPIYRKAAEMRDPIGSMGCP